MGLVLFIYAVCSDDAEFELIVNAFPLKVVFVHVIAAMSNPSHHFCKTSSHKTNDENGCPKHVMDSSIRAETFPQPVEPVLVLVSTLFG